MKKSMPNKTNGNAFKTIVRSVVKEELVIFKVEFKQELKHELKEEIRGLFDINYAKYRDDVLTKLDKAIGELKKGNEEQALHSGQHQETNDRLDELESIHPLGKHA